MATVDDLAAVDAAILAAMASPAEVQSDAGRVKQQSLADLRALRNDLATQLAVTTTSPRRGIRFTKLVPPGID